ncbi:hypothetical protein ACWX0K_10800 [Nitrobacteraceae bacterium UC4446_H13]
MTVNLRWIKWRDGRPRLTHGPRERRMGFKDQDLKHADGRWFTYEEARARSTEHDATILAARASGKKIKPPAKKRTTVADLLDDWQTSDEFKDLSTASRTSYTKSISAILYKPMTRTEAAQFRAMQRAAKLLGQAAPQRTPEDIASATPTSIGKPEIRDFFNYLRRTRGHHMALAVIATLSAAITWGCESTLWRLPGNPRPGMEFDRPDGRVILVPMAEFAAWVAAGDAIERWSVGDSLYLGLFLGQRQTDRLQMRNESETEGRHAFRQSKTGELVDIKEAPQLTTRLDAARARVKAIKLRLGLEELPPEIVINEVNGLPYDDSTYRHWVSTARDVAVFGFLARMTISEAINRAIANAAALRAAMPAIIKKHPVEDLEGAALARALDARGRAVRDFIDAVNTRDSNAEASAWRLPPCPSLMFVNKAGELDAMHDQDLRDTCVMLLDRAGCDLLTICDITGHSYKSAQTIVKHYRARNKDRADQGIDALVLQVRKEGMA